MKYYFGYVVYAEGQQPRKWAEDNGIKTGPPFTAECTVEITSVMFHGLSLETLTNLHPYTPPVNLT